MQTVLIVFHLMVVIGLVATVLLQRSEGGALGVGGGGGFMTGRGQANALTRATAILGTLFFITCRPPRGLRRSPSCGRWRNKRRALRQPPPSPRCRSRNRLSIVVDLAGSRGVAHSQVRVPASGRYFSL